MNKSRGTSRGPSPGPLDKPLLDQTSHMGELSLRTAPPAGSLFPRRLTTNEIVSLWNLLATSMTQKPTKTPQRVLEPEQPQQQQQQVLMHSVSGEAGEEAPPQAGQSKLQSKQSGPQAGSKAPSEKDRKHTKSQKEQKPSQGAPKKHPSSSGRAPAPQGAATQQAAAIGTPGEAPASGSEGARLGPPSSAEGSDPEEAIRSALGIPPCVVGCEAAVALVLRALLFCRDYLIRPEVTSCLINFLGVQLQWLSSWGSVSPRSPASECRSEGQEEAQAGRKTIKTKTPDLGNVSPLSKHSSSGLQQLAYLSRHLRKETERLLQLLSCTQQHSSLGGSSSGECAAAEELDTALVGSISLTEAELLHKFLQYALISHGYFFGVVMTSKIPQGAMPVDKPTVT
ncbi:hypothetical protein Efla_005189 [Eimeria flavescens]